MKYSDSMPIKSLKCHGALASSPASSLRFTVLAVSAAADTGASSERPHVGHVPSVVIAEGAQFKGSVDMTTKPAEKGKDAPSAPPAKS